MKAAEVVQYALNFARKVGAYDPDEYVGAALLAYWKACVRMKSGHATSDKPEAYLQSTITWTCKHIMKDKHKHLDLNVVPDSKISYTIDYTGELIEALKLNPYEKQIVDLRLEGYNDREIGEQLLRTGGAIAKARSKIVERLEQLLKE